MIAVETSELTRRFGTLTAVDRLSLSVPAGSVYALLGPNGAGKTTTLRMILGLARSDRGEIRVAGLPAGFGRTAFLSRVGFLPEDVHLHGWMTGVEFLHFTAGLAGLDRGAARRRAAELLEQVGLRRGNVPISTLSKGMRQRLGIAQALVGNPEVVFLDEPASGLDPIGRREVFELIDGLRGTMTVVMCTHILEDAERLCDRVGIMNEGRLVLDEAMVDLTARHLTRVIEVEIDPAPPDALAFFAGLGSIDSAVEENGVFRLRPGNPGRAQIEVPEAIAALGLRLVRFELVRPRLEDVFVELVSRSAAGGGAGRGG